MPTTIWFTGLSGSGKTTIAQALKTELESRGKTVEILDGDIVREKHQVKLGFSREDIRTNNRLIAQLAKQSTANFVLVPIISPYREDRAMAKNIIGKNFVELFINCPLDHCIERDVKGLYKKALNGEINNFIGITKSNPYEPPLSADLEIRTHINSLSECTQQIIQFLNSQPF